MHLNIKGIGKINYSKIELNGITVIAGENSTGKSTFSKVLYCMFNAFYDTEAAISKERYNDVFFRIFNLANELKISLDNQVNYLIDKFVNKIENNEYISENDIRKFIFDIFHFTNEDSDDVINDIVENIKRSLSITNEDIQKRILNYYFRNIFGRQINHVNESQSIGEISLNIKGKNISVSIENNKCVEFKDNVGIIYNAMYIDTPFAIDKNISKRNKISINYRIDHRENLRHCFYKNQSNNTLIEEVIVDQKIESILTKIDSVIEGKFERDEEGLKFREKNLKKPIQLYSISAGIKTFIIIKRLLELGEIKERGVLIFDEPEIHLHPGWQLKFAEILVLLQKEFNLTILLTTHSPYFIEAIEAYGKKYNIKNQINFYLAENKEDTSDVKNVTNNVEAIYEQLAKPFQKLEDIEYED